MPRADRIRYEEIAEDLRTYYKTTGRRNLEEADRRLAPLKRFFAGRRVASLGPADVTALITRHKTRAIFDRYHIVAPQDLRVATARMAQRDGHNSGHSRSALLDARSVSGENS